MQQGGPLAVTTHTQFTYSIYEMSSTKIGIKYHPHNVDGWDLDRGPSATGPFSTYETLPGAQRVFTIAGTGFFYRCFGTRHGVNVTGNSNVIFI
jgi:hypothetical protein